jgi:hypothetical protein
VCWCELSKTLGKAVQRWRIGANGFKNKTPIFLRTDFKN